MKYSNSKILIFLVICLMGFSSNAVAQNHLVESSIKDTTSLDNLIDIVYSKINDSKEIDLEEVEVLLKSSLQLKDTVSFFELCQKICRDHYASRNLNEEGILFLKKYTQFLGTDSSPHGEFDNSMGNLYLRLGFQAEALEHFYKSVDWHKKYDPIKTTVPIGNVAQIYFNNKNFEKALYYNELALENSLKLKDKEDLLYNVTYDYFRIGSIYYELNENQKAESYFEKSIEAAKALNKPRLTLLTFSKAIKFYDNIGNLEKSSALIVKADRVFQLLRNKESSSANNYLFGKYLHYLNIDRLDQVVSPEKVEFKSAINKGNFYRLSAKYYAKTKNLDKTVASYNKLIEEKNRITTENRKNVFSNIEAKYKNKELEKKNQELITDNIKRKRSGIFVLSALVLALSILFLQLFNNHRYKKVNNLLEIKKKDVEKSNKELARTNKELERFVFIASHDIKTPLHNIVNFTNLLEKQITPYENKSANQYLNFIKQGGQRLDNLISDTLEYTQHSKKGFNFEEKTIDLNSLLTEIEQSIWKYIQENKAQIEILNKLPVIKGHYYSWFVLFKNLIENGIKYNTSDTPTIKIDFKKYDKFYSFFFVDNGIGIAEENKDKVFILFARLHTKDKYTGSGLGLSTCKKIVDQLNGTIELHSELGKGCTFEIKIPIEKIKMEETQTENSVVS